MKSAAERFFPQLGPKTVFSGNSRNFCRLEGPGIHIYRYVCASVFCRASIEPLREFLSDSSARHSPRPPPPEAVSAKGAALRSGKDATEPFGRFPKSGALLGSRVLVIRVIVFWGLLWGPTLYRNHHFDHH